MELENVVGVLVSEEEKAKLKGIELDLEKLEIVENQNVRKEALLARDIKERMDRDSSYEIMGTYTEAYQGEH